jgi:hypothetical protein
VVNSDITVAEGAVNTVLTTSHLSATDADSTDTALIYTVGNVSNGTLTINGNVWDSSTNYTFTQQNIIDGNILYTHDDSNTTSDSFNFTVGDGTNTLTNQMMSIIVTAVDDDPVLVDPQPNIDTNPTEDVDENIDTETNVDNDSETATILDAEVGEEDQLQAQTGLANPSLVLVSGDTPTDPSSVVLAVEPLDQNRQLLDTTLAIQSPFDILIINTDEIDAQQEGEIWQSIDLINKSIEQNQSDDNSMLIGSHFITGSTIGIAAGVIAWLIRAGAVLSSLFTMFPLVAKFDPLPILSINKDEGRKHPAKKTP